MVINSLSFVCQGTWSLSPNHNFNAPTPVEAINRTASGLVAVVWLVNVIHLHLIKSVVYSFFCVWIRGLVAYTIECILFAWHVDNLQYVCAMFPNANSDGSSQHKANNQRKNKTQRPPRNQLGLNGGPKFPSPTDSLCQRFCMMIQDMDQYRSCDWSIHVQHKT